MLWFEPEANAFWMDSDDFDRYGVKKEWLVGYNKDKNSAPAIGTSHTFNLGNKEALSWITDRIKTALTESGSRIYREDFNTRFLRET